MTQMEHLSTGTGLVVGCGSIGVDSVWLRGFIRSEFDEARVERIVLKEVNAAPINENRVKELAKQEIGGYDQSIIERLGGVFDSIDMIAGKLDDIENRVKSLESVSYSHCSIHRDEFVRSEPHPAKEEGIFHVCEDARDRERARESDTDFPVRKWDRKGGLPQDYKPLDEDHQNELRIQFGYGALHEYSSWKITHVAQDWEGWGFITEDPATGKRCKIQVRVHPEIESESESAFATGFNEINRKYTMPRGTGG